MSRRGMPRARFAFSRPRGRCSGGIYAISDHSLSEKAGLETGMGLTSPAAALPPLLGLALEPAEAERDGSSVVSRRRNIQPKSIESSPIQEPVGMKTRLRQASISIRFLLTMK